jgi:uncharacterized membrane protein
MTSIKKWVPFKIKSPSELLFVAVWVFILGSVFGYLFEVSVSYATIGSSEGHQGILYLPMTPIYGFGFWIILILLDRIKHMNLLLQYLICCLAGGTFEILFGLIQIYGLQSRSWNYSNLPLNIMGLTTIPYAMIWGLLGFSFMRIWPFLRRHLMMLKNNMTMLITRAVLLFLIVDACLSVAICIRGSERANAIQAHHKIDQWMDVFFPDALIHDQWPGMKFK